MSERTVCDFQRGAGGRASKSNNNNSNNSNPVHYRRQRGGTDRINAARVAICTDTHDRSLADDSITKSLVSTINQQSQFAEDCFNVETNCSSSQYEHAIRNLYSPKCNTNSSKPRKPGK